MWLFGTGLREDSCHKDRLCHMLKIRCQNLQNLLWEKRFLPEGTRKVRPAREVNWLRNLRHIWTATKQVPLQTSPNWAMWRKQKAIMSRESAAVTSPDFIIQEESWRIPDLIPVPENCKRSFLTALDLVIWHSDKHTHVHSLSVYLFSYKLWGWPKWHSRKKHPSLLMDQE